MTKSEVLRVILSIQNQSCVQSLISPTPVVVFDTSYLFRRCHNFKTTIRGA